MEDDDDRLNWVGGRWNCYDRQGHRITFREWAEMRGPDPEQDYRRVAGTTVGPYWVSTVWLGLDHAHMGPPLIFETMVFHEESGMTDIVCERYSTESQALAGHALVVADVEQWVRIEQDIES